MMKKILYTILFIALAVGTVYSWQKVDFTRKSLTFFQMAFGDENSMGRPGGPPPTGDNRGGDMSRPAPSNGQAMGPDSRERQSGPPAMGEGGERGPIPDFGRSEQGGERGAGPDSGQGEQGGERGAGPEFRQGQPGERPPGGGPPGGNISLRNVAKYTVIMAFFVMLTRLLDQLVLRMKRSRKSA